MCIIWSSVKCAASLTIFKIEITFVRGDGSKAVCLLRTKQYEDDVKYLPWTEECGGKTWENLLTKKNNLELQKF